MPLMKSLRDLRLSNLSGHCVLVKANQPINIPDGLRNDAILAGMADCEEQPKPPVVDKEVEAKAAAEAAEAAEADAAERSEQLDAAILIVLTRNDEGDFKKDGTPKATKIVAELPPEFEPRPTATEISDAYEKLQENFDLAED